jgi:hypothetical protein
MGSTRPSHDVEVITLHCCETQKREKRMKNLAGASKEGYGSKSFVLSVMMMISTNSLTMGAESTSGNIICTSDTSQATDSAQFNTAQYQRNTSTIGSNPIVGFMYLFMVYSKTLPVYEDL